MKEMLLIHCSERDMDDIWITGVFEYRQREAELESVKEVRIFRKQLYEHSH